MEDELNEVKASVVTFCQSTFLWLSLVIIILELVFLVDGENLLNVNNSMQFLGLYIFELIPLAYYIQIKKIEKKVKNANRKRTK